MQDWSKQTKASPFLEASGLLRLDKIRKDITLSGQSNGLFSTSAFPNNETQSEDASQMDVSSDVVEKNFNPENLKLEAKLFQRFREFLEIFAAENLAEECFFSLSNFIILMNNELFKEENVEKTENLLKDVLIFNRIEFLKLLNHPNWRWKSVFETNFLRNFFLEDVIPASLEPEAKILLGRIALEMFSGAVLEETNFLSDDFLTFVAELSRLPDFPAVFLWIFLELVASDEMQPYLKGGVSQVPDFSVEEKFGSLYDENSRHLNTPSLLRFRPEPRELKFTPLSGIISVGKRKKLRNITIKIQQAKKNQFLAMDVFSICCENFSSSVFSSANFQVSGIKNSGGVQESPASPKEDENSPSSPPPEATGIPQESPASPDLPEMRTSKMHDEKLPERFRVEYKEGLMKMFLLPGEGEDAKKGDGRPTYGTMKRALYALGGWHWLSVCLIDILRPEESDKAVWWPEFQSVAFFNRNVHIVNAFKKNPLWMLILEAASALPDAFLYYSPLLRPIYISLYTHWETSMEGPTAARNMQAREQTLWLLRCLSKSKLIHEPYCYLTGVLDHMAAHEISSILASLWKVIKTYMPNPHGLLYIPDTEQDFRARQMAETDCLLKIRAVIFSRLSSVGLIGKQFFAATRVPLEESRWYESKESQETASAPAPLDTAHLEKVD